MFTSTGDVLSEILPAPDDLIGLWLEDEWSICEGCAAEVGGVKVDVEAIGSSGLVGDEDTL